MLSHEAQAHSTKRVKCKTDIASIYQRLLYLLEKGKAEFYFLKKSEEFRNFIYLFIYFLTLQLVLWKIHADSCKWTPSNALPSICPAHQINFW